MAVDGVLARGNSRREPTVRVYAWQPYAISIGYHQDAADLDVQKCNNEGIGFVRRPTGGRAIYHAEEVTYSIVIPRSCALFNHSPSGLYNRISAALICGLRLLEPNLTLERRPQGRHAGFAESGLRGVCFASSATYEIKYRNRKLVGSAQRRFPEAVLQHGSILLGDEHLEIIHLLSDKQGGSSEYLQACTISFESILKRELPYDEVVSVIKSGFEETFGVRLDLDQLSAEEEKSVADMIPEYTNL